MKKIIWTIITTVAITSAAVYGWDHIVVDHFGFYNYPEWMAYGLLCICAYAGGMLGDVMSMIDWNFRRWKRTATYITKELL